MKGRDGFTLIETLIVIAIIAILAGIVMAALSGAQGKARDVKRKAEVSQMGRLLSFTCFVPSGGTGDYDIADLIPELQAAYPQYAAQLANFPRDPKTGSAAESKYRYIVNGSGKCAVYANLESDDPVTLGAITTATPGGGTGVYAAPSIGWNGSAKYFQASN